MGVDAAKTLALMTLLRSSIGRPPRRILVVGCGSGREAGMLARGFAAETFGIDIGAEFEFDFEAARPATLRTMDAQALDFGSETFDLVYSFHALEHIADYHKALNEMSRVLRRGGSYCIGTPNKARFVGYMGAAVPLRTKLAWNLIDLSKRVRGRWSNEQGAHAGFYADDLRRDCLACFGDAWNVTDEYYLTLYHRQKHLITRIASTSVKYRIFPCVYVIGRKVAPTDGRWPTGRGEFR